MKTTSRMLSLAALLVSIQANAQTPASDAPKATETEPVAAEPAAAEPTPNPAPEATPAPNPEIKPAPKGKPDAELEKMKPTEAPKAAPDHHMDTPDFLDDKLTVRMGFGLGFGNKEISADLMGFQAETSYAFADTIFGSFRYTSFTGVKSDDDRSYVAQSYLLGGGLEIPVLAQNKARIHTGAFLGMTKFSNWDLVIFSPGKTTYTFTPAATVSFDYDLFEKCFVTAGAGAQFGKAAWYDVQVGFGARF